MKKIADISHHNGTINWAEAGKELDLAIIRVQYGSNTIDTRYKEYVQGCKAYGVPFGHYAYGCYTSVQDAIVEAKDFMERADKGAKFLVLDVEDDTLASCGPTNLAKASQAFIDTCRAAGRKVGLYVSHHMYTSYGLNSISADFLWIPRYGGSKPAYNCDIWQYTETGILAGVSGNVDLNYLNGNKSLEWFIGNGSNSTDVDTRQNVSLPPDWQTKMIGTITVTVPGAPVLTKPDINSAWVGRVPKNSGHAFLGWYHDGAHFWYEIAVNNWIREDVCVINDDGKRSKGGIYVNAANVKVYEGANMDDKVVGTVSWAILDVDNRYNNWLHITKPWGWISKEDYVKWVR
ncbi:glycoside hydrolase family 25 [Bacillus wiedmannii]|uniref:GH25 family lysozyme n=1 Tax=Bacillus wiedmannii TaxID=1890302 RepID=UPI000BFB4BB1|nr:GH25 family lysozyme [Bacillus wiedmannii]PHD16789.1 glycoside hydrolase family 25 [Bacillus wiedmannii]